MLRGNRVLVNADIVVGYEKFSLLLLSRKKAYIIVCLSADFLYQSLKITACDDIVAIL